MRRLLILLLFVPLGSALAKEKMSWNMDVLDIQMLQGQTQTFDLVLYNFSGGEGAKLHVVPALQEWVSIHPSIIEDTSDQEHALVVLVSSRTDSPVGTFDGVIQVREFKAGKSNSALTMPLPVILKITDAVSSLPPDPGSKNDQTLVGIDSDLDGVRDDIQRYIVMNYGDNEALKLALLQGAKVNQLKLILSGDKEASRHVAKLSMRVVECVGFVSDMDMDAFDEYQKITAKQMNTRQRSKAYDQYQQNLAGSITYTTDGDGSESCEFDVLATSQ
ncbi:hypothetical protein BCS96_15855 [Vibrio breoganii]|uniref:Uncharacterized protein n=3 Tax=Vibrio breoganii TaxID=553239 RepID=A0AAP8SW09_9VIBR|nr:hypothetical protein [Vibrio breoganii]OEF84055.1 hypothetical protein B003_01190 [Vibrio breoganii 1C10]OCH70852.1 hypothetical protein A6D95_05135 [Vibrio breoganii]OED96814.1 hypothetical protein A1QG_16260 [Vibrio breoganii ZF-29]PMG85237.1 hypothetical protein BCU81_13215 [Vibrio breoganii]PMG91425.1 hypothetical protein BCU79_17235 [Vibrio breoganii]